ncbi:DUF6220 domain-containing protein [Rugosimonospora africana]|nr:DUF6220 domain-containing protein [Rugosimonospora africana]
MSTTTTPSLDGYRATTTQVMRYLAMAGGTLALAQFALAGFGAFNSVNGHRHGYTAHETVGTIVELVGLLVLIAALVARPNRRTIILAVVLFLLAGPIQPSLAELAKNDQSWLGALHGLVGLAILGLFFQLSRKVTADG